MLFLTR